MDWLVPSFRWSAIYKIWIQEWILKIIETELTVKGTHKNGCCVLVTANEVKTAKKKPVDLFIVNKIKYQWIDDEFKCYEGETRLISPWKPKSNKSSLKEISYKFCPEKKWNV